MAIEVVSFGHVLATEHCTGVRMIRLDNEYKPVVCGRPFFSVRDVIILLCNQDKNNAGRTWRNISDEVKHEVQQKVLNFQFAGQGQSAQPVLTYTGVMRLIQVLPGERAKLNRIYFTDTMTRYFSGDPTMVDELAENAASTSPMHALAREELAAVGGGVVRASTAVVARPAHIIQIETIASVQAASKLQVAQTRAKRDEDLAKLAAKFALESGGVVFERRLSKEKRLKLENDAKAAKAEAGVVEAKMAVVNNEIALIEAEIKLKGLKRKRDALENQANCGARAGIYVLELKDARFYVGKSKDIDARIAQHHVKKTVVRELPPLTNIADSNDLDTWERIETLARMKEHGVDGVRGWAFTQPWLSAPDQHSAVSQVCERFDLCRRCGRSGHFITECFAHGPAAWLPKAFDMPPALVA